jgi:DNA-directed RNA polymerase specialized sigma24 family protein
MTDLNPFIVDLVPSVARSIVNRFGKWVDKDDVKQECLIWAMSRTEWVNQQLNEPNTEQRKHNESKLAWQMMRHAERYARKEKAARSGYQPGDEAFYQSATLAKLLPFVIASILDGTVLEPAQEMVLDGQPRGSSSPAEGGALLSTLMDIKKQFVKLGAEDRQILTLRYHEQMTLAQIGAVLECHATTADRRCDHAMRELLNLLGGKSPWGN